MPQPVIPPLPRAALPDDMRPMFDAGVARTGDATIIQVMGHQPDIARWYFEEFYGGLFYNRHPGMRVDVRTKELLRIKLSKQHGCQFCNRSNTVDRSPPGSARRRSTRSSIRARRSGTRRTAPSSRSPRR